MDVIKKSVSLGKGVVKNIISESTYVADTTAYYFSLLLNEKYTHMVLALTGLKGTLLYMIYAAIEHGFSKNKYLQHATKKIQAAQSLLKSKEQRLHDSQPDQKTLEGNTAISTLPAFRIV